MLLKKFGFLSIQHFNENVEGYESYSYILAKLNKKKLNYNYKNEKNVYRREIDKYKKYLNNYYLKCLKLKKKLDNEDSYVNRKNFIKKNKVYLLNIGEETAVNRFCDEALSFLKHVKIKN